MTIDQGRIAKDFIRDVVARAEGDLESIGDPVAAILPGGIVSHENEGLETLSPPRSSVRHSDLVMRTAEKVVADEPLDDDEQFALEAIIIPDKRPAVDVIGGSFTVTHPLWLHLNEGEARARIEAVIPSVGRVELPSNPLLPFAGTGFVVGDGLLMTNRHVAVLFAGGPGELRFLPGARPAVDFLRERADAGGDGGSLNLRVLSVEMIHPYWDMALLRVEGFTASQTPLTLSLSEPAALEGRDVVLIGYPAFDPTRNNQAVQNEVFGGVYNVKRLMPGLFTGSQAIKSFGKLVSSVTHDASSLGGASGSAVLDVATGEIVGLHFAGIYLKSNYGVPTSALARDGRVIDAGLKFAGTPTRAAGEWDVWWRKFGASPAPAPAESAGGGAAAGEQSASIPSLDIQGASEWTIPITVTVRVGAPVPPRAAVGAAEAPTPGIEVPGLPEDAFVALGGDDDAMLRQG